MKKGTHHSKKTKEKIRIFNLGKLHSEETKKKISLSNLGKKQTEMTKKKISETHKRLGLKPVSYKRNPYVEIICKECGLKFEVNYSRRNSAKYCSFKCSGTGKQRKSNNLRFVDRQKVGEENSKRLLGKKGKNTPNWNGGRTKLSDTLRTCREYKQWRKKVFKRDNYTCQICGDNIGGNLEADHIIPFSYLLKENNIKTFSNAINCKQLWDINNGRTLCSKCHKETDTYLEKAINWKPKMLSRILLVLN